MDAEQSRLQYLLTQYASQSCSETERDELLALLNADNQESAVLQALNHWMQERPTTHIMPEEAAKITLQKILGQNSGMHEDKIHTLKAAWLKYAAAIIILLGIGAYLWNTQLRENSVITTTKPVGAEKEDLPGANRAILTLADGRTILLDSAANGQLAVQQGATISKNANGEIVYSSTGTASEVVYNTMATPRGGQYQLKLPDGSLVWLNAGSSITYPTAFIEKTREVKVTGEVYFEVAKNAAKQFIVSVEGKPSVQVLGTHFNINAYSDEPAMTTTLLEGSVKTGNVLLQPGQQTIAASPEKITVNKSADVQQAMAWKNGVFNFNNQNLESVMRQLARWYDVEVVYPGKIPAKQFWGEMGMDLKLDDVLDFLRKSNIHVTYEKGKLIVTQ